MVVGVAVQPYLNLPALLIVAVVTVVLVIGIRESALTNAVLVLVKVGRRAVRHRLGCGYVAIGNWTACR